jgi:hemerythrin-like metal-binding protein
MKITLSKKLYGLIGASLIVLTIISLLAIFGTRSLISQYRNLGEEDGVQKEFSLQAANHLGIAVQAFKNKLVRGDAASEKAFEEATGMIESWLNGYASVSDGPEETKLAEDARKALAHYRGTFADLVKTRAKNANALTVDRTLAHGADKTLREAIVKMEELAAINYAAKQKTVNASAAFINLVQIVLAVLAVVFGLVAGSIIIRKIIASISAVSAAAKQVSQGDLSSEVPITSNDEIGEMAGSFNVMIKNVRRVVEQINTATSTLAASSEELSATSEELSKGSNDLASQTEQVVTAMTEVSQTIMDMARNASQAADASKTTSETATKGKQVIETTANGMASIATTVQGAAATIEELGRSSAQIGEIVATINGIADQTNLLALNAAIEAARAGEQGRGFAVVADEVRKLAERTSQATRDIGQRISAIQQAAAESVDAMKRGSDEVDKGVGLAQEASGSLDSIVTASSNATDMVQRIAAATEEQSAATEEVSQNMETISGITRQSAASTEQVKSSAEGLAKLAVELKETASWFKMNGSRALLSEAGAEYRQATYAPALPSPASSSAAITALSRDSRSGRLIDWSNDLSVHIHEIDEQHKILIGLINDMYDALKAARGKDAVENILPRLVDYTVTHFANEEHIMEKHGYPGFLNHRKLHEALKAQVGEYAARLKEGRSTAVVEFMAFLKDWLTKHIVGVDMKYSPHLRKKGMT